MYRYKLRGSRGKFTQWTLVTITAKNDKDLVAIMTQDNPTILKWKIDSIIEIEE